MNVGQLSWKEVSDDVLGGKRFVSSSVHRPNGPSTASATTVLLVPIKTCISLVVIFSIC